MENEEDFLTLREAARLLNITHQAIRSRARHREVELIQAPGVHGVRYLLHQQDLERLRDGCAEPSRATVSSTPDEGHGTVSRNRLAQPSRGTVPFSQDDETVSRNRSAQPSRETVPLTAHLETLQILRETQHSLLDSQTQAQRLERQTTMMQFELASYQRALSEHAESLAEKTTVTRQIEIRADLAESERIALLEENRRLREQYEQEKEALTADLQTAKTRVNWLEKKVPTWLRRMLGAS